MKLVAVCISTKREHWGIPSVPFYCSVVAESPLARGTLQKVQRAADRRNQGVKDALQEYPGTTDIFMVDSWYLDQVGELEKIITEYEFCSKQFGECIVGASTWCYQPNSIRKKPMFFDGWVTPEAMQSNYGRGGLIKVNAVGAAYLFPRWVWEKHPFSHTALESENTYFCRESGLTCYLSFNASLWHPSHSFFKRVRVSLALGRLLR